MRFLRRHSLPIGILLMYALTWTVHLSASGVLHLRLPAVVYWLGGWGFGVAAVLMTWLTLGGAAVVDLLRRFVLWKIGWKWYASVLLIPLTYLLGIAAHALFTGTRPDLASRPLPEMLSIAALVFIGNVLGNGEEIGWRGYALPRLQSRYSALYSAIALGLIWALWHIAVYIRSFNPIWFAWYIVSVIAKSVLIAWAYNGSGGSLLLATLYHAMWNAAGAVLPLTDRVSNADIGTYAYVVMCEVAVAIVLTVLAGPGHLSRTRPRQVQGSLPIP
ncbi:MAG TPA: type II CAAX endopeptidase family protein [Anaerolineales bacterium]